MQRSPPSQESTVSSLQPKNRIIDTPWRWNAGELSPTLLLLKLLNYSQVDSIHQELRPGPTTQRQVLRSGSRFKTLGIGSLSDFYWGFLGGTSSKEPAC